MSKNRKDIKKILSATALAGVTLGAGVSAQAADNMATPTLGDESLYIMTEIGRGDNFNPDSIGSPYITKYEYNNETGEITPVYYSYGENPKLQIDDLVDGSTTHQVIEAATTINTSYFDNSSTENGGAILVNSEDKVNINGHFVGNYSELDGGAIYKNRNASIGTIKGDFLGNESYNSGGAIHTYHNGNVEKIIGDFIENRAYSEGGAIFNRSNIENLTANFVQNYASNEGGAILNYNTLNIKDSGFYQNITYEKGGAISNRDNSSLQIDNTIFAENEVRAGSDFVAGGAIYYGGPEDKSVNQDLDEPEYNNITNSVFIKNTVYQEELPASLDDEIQPYNDYSYTLAGGAIANQGTLGNIDADFIENSVISSEYMLYRDGYGGAIYNTAGINGTITGLFKDNKVEVSQGAYGGAIYNDYNIGTMSEIDDHMVQNIDVYEVTTTSESGETLVYYGVGPEGGEPALFAELEYALAEGMKIGTLNTIVLSRTVSDEEFEVVKQEFESALEEGFLLVQNPVDLIPSESYYTGPEFVGGIEADFVGNIAHSYGDDAMGGAIRNTSWGLIANIKGNFVNNSAISESYYAKSGAIDNNGMIGVIGGEAKAGEFATQFVGNTASASSEAVAGAIYNGYSINNIKNVLFDSNKAQAYDYAYGGAISNEGMIGAEEKYYGAESVSTYESNTPYLGDYILFQDKGIVNSAFVNNLATSYYSSLGGALYSYSAIVSNIKGSLFQGNKAEVLKNINIDNLNPRIASPYAQGGAIYNSDSVINKIADTTFKNNSAINNEDYGYVEGGAIYNNEYGEINSIENSVFDGNKAEGGESAYGGAILNDGCIGNISGEFKNNSAVSYRHWAEGGAISGTNWDSYFGDINANFTNNSAQVLSTEYGNAMGGAIALETGYYGNIIGNFTGNYAKGGNAYGGAVFLAESSIDKIPTISGTFSGNYVRSTEESWGRAYGGAIYNGWSKRAGALSLSDTPTTYMEVSSYSPIIKNSSFINNYAIADGEDSYALGGAIYTQRDLDIIAKDGYKSLISGNYVEDCLGKRNEAIYAEDWSNLQFIAENNGSIQIDDAVVLNGGAVHFTGDETGKITLNNNIYAITPQDYSLDEEFDSNIYGGTSWVYLSNSNLHLGLRDNVLDNHYLTLYSGSFSMINNEVGVSNPYNLTINGDTKFYGDVDLKNEVMDRFEVQDSYGQRPASDGDEVYNGYNEGNLVVSGLNMISDMKEGQDVAAIYFAEKGLMNNVEANFGEMPHPEQTTFYTPIYKYNAVYDNTNDYGQGEGGYFVFTRGDKIPVIVPGGGSNTPTVTPSGKPSDAFNPAVLGSSTSATVGALGTMNATMHYAFQNADNYMHIPYLERIAIRDRNKYALSPTGDATDVGTYSPLFTKNEYGSAWFKPYASFESVGLKNGPKVSNITYGSLVGFDTDLESIKGGWDRTFTGYIGYNGASQRYSGVDSYQNGGLIGGTLTLYKGNFFNATTISTGASVANNTNMYGNEDYAMLLAGIGNKTGYNFEFKEGKVILQPSMLMSYTFVNTFDYTNAAGVRIDNKPLHALQLAPGVKVIGNTKNGWQPYVGVSMVWNLMGESDATANGVKLPEMSIKPYVQYGVGVQKRFKDHFMGFGQAMIQNGGRNGISLTAGFRWAIGHDCKYKVDKSDKLDKSVKGHSDENQNLTMKQAKSSNGEILNHRVGTENFVSHTQLIFQSVQNDSKCHYEEQSDVVIPSNNEIATPTARNDKVSSASGKKILKQLSPEQKMALGGKYISSRTASTGMLKQL